MGARSDLFPADTDAAKLVTEAIELLDSGEARVAEVDPAADEVVVHEWLKRRSCCCSSLRAMETTELGPFEFADKLPAEARVRRGRRPRRARCVGPLGRASSAAA